MEKDFDLDVRVAVAPQQATPDGFASIGTTCWSCGGSQCCPLTTLPYNLCG
ncbi:FDLD family class I lanthipeptide [Streptomyces sp. NPDC052396]|uniref:FDLD family class I lanthipeptide n=1 Tax=Streptomyces sp. NPDC052396 TaxID=3365689 RepID=UPI0037D326BE